eukprot:scaffold7016_cov123-Isochrysis_galbana.AAC.5
MGYLTDIYMYVCMEDRRARWCWLPCSSILYALSERERPPHSRAYDTNIVCSRRPGESRQGLSLGLSSSPLFFVPPLSSRCRLGKGEKGKKVRWQNGAAKVGDFAMLARRRVARTSRATKR